MKSLLIGAAAVLSMSGVVMATNVISIPDVVIDWRINPVVTVDVAVSGPDAFQGMNLYLEIQGSTAFEIIDLEIDGWDYPDGQPREEVPGYEDLLFHDNCNWPSMEATFYDDPVSVAYPNWAIGYIATSYGSVSPPGVLARVTIECIRPAMGETAILTANTSLAPSDFARSAPPAEFVDSTFLDGTIAFVPEPSAALLFLCAVPFLRRRARA